eukprot:COSAG04_NODE_1350_length_7125_cov_2.893711_1_plen_49_part_10
MAGLEEARRREAVERFYAFEGTLKDTAAVRVAAAGAAPLAPLGASRSFG